MNLLVVSTPSVVNNCGGTPKRRKLSEESGLAGSQISTVLKRLDKDPEAIEVETVKAIAKGAKVSPDWLLTGRGDPEPGAELPAENESFEDPRFGNLPNWLAILQAAKTLAPELPIEIWEVIAQCHPLATAPITPGMVADRARCTQPSACNSRSWGWSRCDGYRTNPAADCTGTTRQAPSRRLGPSPSLVDFAW